MKKLFFLLILVACFFLFEYFSGSDSLSQNEQPPKQAIEQSAKQLEIPVINEGEVIFEYSAITIKYDTIHLIPSWVAYELKREELEGDVERCKSFSMDLNYKGRQAMREDYSKSGWDKGHMAPAADMKWSKQAMYECFYLTNICPQNHELNGQSWKKLETWCRNIAQKCGTVYIVTGPLISTNQYGTIGERKVTVPDRFYKALLIRDDAKYHSIAFVMNNNSFSQSLPSSAISVNDLEQLSGIDFFPNLDDCIEEKVESENDFTYWNNYSH